MSEPITTTLILAGAGMMTAAMLATVGVVRVLETSRYLQLWRALLLLQGCCFLGYLAACVLIVLRHADLFLPLAGGMLCAIALFALLVARLGAVTITDLQGARDEAEATSRARSIFLANMHHELRTPLNAIIGYSSVLLDETPANAVAAQDLRQIRAAGAQVLSLIDDILDQAKIEAGRIELHPAPIDLPALLDELDAAARSLAEQNDNQLTIQADPDLPPLVTDGQRLRQILLNLLGNACTSTEHGVVSMVVRRDGAALRFTVRDTGAGLSREQLARLFRPFVQATGHTVRRYRGTGLGLSIARDLARLMGGDIGVVSAPGRGSVFTLSLPCAPPAARTATGAHRREPVTIP